jgi:hypothetical protein
VTKNPKQRRSRLAEYGSILALAAQAWAIKEIFGECTNREGSTSAAPPGRLRGGLGGIGGHAYGRRIWIGRSL